jgi:hypothetical protein
VKLIKIKTKPNFTFRSDKREENILWKNTSGLLMILDPEDVCIQIERFCVQSDYRHIAFLLSDCQVS